MTKKLISIKKCSELYGPGSARLYALHKANPDLPFWCSIGSQVRVNTSLYEKFLDKASREGRKL